MKQCSNCKTVVERIDGCNHMTCQCLYEFCYVCGAGWNPKDCAHDYYSEDSFNSQSDYYFDELDQ